MNHVTLANARQLGRLLVVIVAVFELTVMANAETHWDWRGLPYTWHAGVGEMCGEGGTYRADGSGGLWCDYSGGVSVSPAPTTPIPDRDRGSR